MYDSIYPYIRDIGATAIIFALLIIDIQRSKMQHERSLARSKMQAEKEIRLIDHLVECLKCKS